MKKYRLLVLIVFFLFNFLSISHAAYLCGDNGFIFNNQSLCNAVCSTQCGDLKPADGAGFCDTDNYKGFVYNPNTEKTYALSKTTGFFTNFSGLASVHSFDLNTVFQDILKFYGFSYGWIGLYDPNMSIAYNTIDINRFSWSDASRFDYSNWADGQPDNQLLGNDLGANQPYLGEHWVVVSDNGTWYDMGYHSGNEPLYPAFVEFNGVLNCVSGIPNSHTTTADNVSEQLIAQYCNGETPCYICGDTDNTTITQCLNINNNPFCPLNKVKCEATYTNPTGCPNNTNFDNTTGKCEANADEQCDSGTTWNPDDGYCEDKPYCPNTYSKNPCPSGYNYDNVSEQCEAPVDRWACPSGYDYDNVSGQCKKPPTIVCPPAQAYTYVYVENGQYVCRNVKIHLCPDNYTYSNLYYKCIASKDADGNCPSPGTWSSSYNHCVTNSTGYGCSTGYTDDPWQGSGTHIGDCKSTDVTIECPSGATYDNNTRKCITQQHAVCLDLGTYDENSSICIHSTTGGYSPDDGVNPDSDKCELNPYYHCPDNTYTFNPDLNACIGNHFTCPDNSTYNSNTTECEADAIPYCPKTISNDSTTYDNETGNCTFPLACSSNGTYNSTVKKCVLQPDIQCPNGFTYNNNIKKCTSLDNITCLLGGSFDNNTGNCTATPADETCPDGYTLDNTTCIATPSCNAGTYNSADKMCESDANYSCSSSGYTFNSTIYLCVKTPYCPYPTVFDSNYNICETDFKYKCPNTSLYLHGTLCTATPNCYLGTFNKNTQECVYTASQICGLSYKYDSNRKRCVRAPQCFFGDYSDAYNTCVKGGKNPYCNIGTYDNETRKCETNPICSHGTYDNNTGECYAGDTTCPYGSQYPCVNDNGTNYCSPNQCQEVSAGIVDDNETTVNNDKKNDGEMTDNGCADNIYIFNGNTYHCRLPGIATGGSNCCKKKKDWFGLGYCKQNEWRLAQLRDASTCHYVGKYCSIKVLGVCLQKAETYCCYHGMLARIVQEQARTTQSLPQAGWGSPKSADCQGFRPNQFQELDWSKIDLSEFYNYIESKIVPAATQSVTNAVNKLEQEYSH